MSKVLWAVFLIPTTIIVTLSIIISVEKKKDEELTRKVLEDMKREEQIYPQNEDANSYRKNMPNANENEYPW